MLVAVEQLAHLTGHVYPVVGLQLRLQVLNTLLLPIDQGLLVPNLLRLVHLLLFGEAHLLHQLLQLDRVLVRIVQFLELVTLHVLLAFQHAKLFLILSVLLSCECDFFLQSNQPVAFAHFSLFLNRF